MVFYGVEFGVEAGQAQVQLDLTFDLTNLVFLCSGVWGVCKCARW